MEDIQPMLGYHQLQVIRAYLADKVSPFLQVEVINPAYEKIRVSCAIRLKNEFKTEQGVRIGCEGVAVVDEGFDGNPFKSRSCVVALIVFP